VSFLVSGLSFAVTCEKFAVKYQTMPASLPLAIGAPGTEIRVRAFIEDAYAWQSAELVDSIDRSGLFPLCSTISHLIVEADQLWAKHFLIYQLDV
jgi:hypothetical protein